MKIIIFHTKALMLGTTWRETRGYKTSDFLTRTHALLEKIYRVYFLKWILNLLSSAFRQSQTKLFWSRNIRKQFWVQWNICRRDEFAASCATTGGLCSWRHFFAPRDDICLKGWTMPLVLIMKLRGGWYRLGKQCSSRRTCFFA